MQTDTYSNLLTLVKGLSGNTTLTSTEETLVGNFINRRIYNAYRRFAYWPRYFVGGEARVVASTTVSAGSFVVGAKYTILVVGNTNWVSIGAASNTVGVKFTATGVGTGTGTATYYYNYIPFTQSTKNDIDTFFRIYDQAPYVVNSVDEFEFIVTSSGRQVISNTDDLTTFYVDYKKEWGGDYNSSTNPNVPLEFFQYAAHGAFADFLRYDGQNEKAAVEDAYAEGLLVLELENAMNQRNSNRTTRFRSHATAQSRF